MFSIVVSGVAVKPEMGKRAVFEITEASPETGRLLKRQIETGVIRFLIEYPAQGDITYGCVCEDEHMVYQLYSTRK